ncbi:hypothetical protein TNIN_449681 [Trichonephila inaurata madagascariensis]|uniref:Uncharacterized protein n=1 Tax=Trichonephila inaurata madagascariensis TaxID=2747483 RepID=A0A8X6I5H3_9ARAC|nr:hypothetical protein TNIN_449681 [Trichonephila inaurata madagascariensis]
MESRYFSSKDRRMVKRIPRDSEWFRVKKKSAEKLKTDALFLSTRFEKSGSSNSSGLYRDCRMRSAIRGGGPVELHRTAQVGPLPAQQRITTPNSQKVDTKIL